jgi:hypothetical protein
MPCPERPSSVEAAALSDKELRQTSIAVAIGCGGWFDADWTLFASQPLLPF